MELEIVTERMPLVEIYPDVAKAIGLPDAEFVRKHYICEKAPELQTGERALIAYVSTEEIDRDMEVIKTRGIDLKYFRKNPVVLWGHDPSIPPVAKADWIKPSKAGDTNVMMAKVVFAEHALADEIYTLYKGGFLKAFSIGFIVTGYREPKTNEFGDDTEMVRGVIEKCQLLEFSCVNVPANQGALVAAIAKSAIFLSDDTQRQLGISDEDEIEDAPELDADNLTLKLESAIDDLNVATDAMVQFSRDFRKAFLPESEEITDPVIEIESDGKEVFKCECIECSYKTDSEKHCADIKCPECGAQMRRAGRPGPGQASLSPTDDDVAKAVSAEIGKISGKLLKHLEERLTQITGRVTPTE